MEIEPFMVSHSVVDAMGFHTLTKVDGKSYAGIINNGDFLVEENMPVGQSFNFETYTDLLKRKLTTNVQIDSTSTVPNGSERIGFEQAVQNTLQVIEANSDRSLIVSPVISRSVENIAIDIAAARKLGTKVYLEGKWLQLVKQAMTDSGHLDFDDVVYRGALDHIWQTKALKENMLSAPELLRRGWKNIITIAATCLIFRWLRRPGWLWDCIRIFVWGAMFWFWLGSGLLTRLTVKPVRRCCR